MSIHGELAPPPSSLCTVNSGQNKQELYETKISSYQEALAKMKDATGVSCIQEVVDRFLYQAKTKEYLKKLEAENTLQLSHLEEKKEKLQAQFEDMKYSGEAKMLK